MFMKKNNEKKSLWNICKESIVPLRKNNKTNFFKSLPHLQKKSNEGGNEGKWKKADEETLDLEKLHMKLFQNSSGLKTKGRQTQKKHLEIGDFSKINKTDARGLSRGKIKIEGKLDLHAMNTNESSVQVVDFINESFLKNRKKVIIITGKGSGILQAFVPQCLNSFEIRNKILAFDYAKDYHGGRGALYVLLKSNKSNKRGDI